ncbi:MAG: hemerythrin domain-containing protein [Solirubrobacteraceae bacterium]|nr:hemerythrin domain-containing protein [Solirubrobacteraceae bacterium]
MDDGTLGALGAALEREHREIDAGVEAYRRGLVAGDASGKALGRTFDALRRHIYLEEAFLFPAMRDELAIPTLVMLREHGELWRTMDAIEAASDVDASLAACDELMARLDAHNEKEEPIFYGRADVLLAPSEHAELTAFLEAGRMPDGWVCQTAHAPRTPGPPPGRS